jgi:hypothetical protein
MPSAEVATAAKTGIRGAFLVIGTRFFTRPAGLHPMGVDEIYLGKKQK